MTTNTPSPFMRGRAFLVLWIRLQYARLEQRNRLRQIADIGLCTTEGGAQLEANRNQGGSSYTKKQSGRGQTERPGQAWDQRQGWGQDDQYYWGQSPSNTKSNCEAAATNHEDHEEKECRCGMNRPGFLGVFIVWKRGWT
ncbi:MAG TPA: hypothetical protein PKC22_16650, partial [Rhodocyclaceae bacterium]|nr:hypothetical protein [Rhodocyclaceae bacterium]